MPFDPLAEYLGGLVGCTSTPEANAEFDAFVTAQGYSPDGGVIADQYGLSGSGVGKLTALWVYMERLAPGLLPGSAQVTGDCVAHAMTLAATCTQLCEIAAGRPDEVTGLVEQLPDQPDEGRRDRVNSCEAVWWHRGRGGSGWQCEIAAKVICEKSGLWPRKNYEQFGFDLTTYNRGGSNSLYGARTPPDEVTREGQQHLMRTATRCTTYEQVRDFLANGMGIGTCGGEGWSSRRQEHGYAPRQGGWAHALTYIGCDERPEVIRVFGEPLICISNSWARWNSGPRRVLGTDLDIPEGCWWAKWSDCKNRSAIAFSGFNGWAAKQLPDWTTGIF